MRIYTLGYTGLKMDKIVEKVVELNAILVDVRFMPFSRFPGWRKTAFKEALNGLCGVILEGEAKPTFTTRYCHMAEFGNENYKTGGMGNIKLHNPKQGLAKIDALLTADDHPLILMCSCEDPEQCHRTEVARMIVNELPRADGAYHNLTYEEVMGVPKNAKKEKLPSKAQLARLEREAQTSLFATEEGQASAKAVRFQHRDDS